MTSLDLLQLQSQCKNVYSLQLLSQQHRHLVVIAVSSFRQSFDNQYILAVFLATFLKATFSNAISTTWLKQWKSVTKRHTNRCCNCNNVVFALFHYSGCGDVILVASVTATSMWKRHHIRRRLRETSFLLSRHLLLFRHYFAVITAVLESTTTNAMFLQLQSSL